MGSGVPVSSSGARGRSARPPLSLGCGQAGLNATRKALLGTLPLTLRLFKRAPESLHARCNALFFKTRSAAQLFQPARLIGGLAASD
ncbi:hypothetical protein C8263_15780 [Deinococcus arcticus]|uniref:Uncharacterized protein n=1 Tax=Deinococcus arcticus TaxID=2136176 RepID=A0A2T3W4I0_9DEIO|nr:hypothetical protein C8263_15780 [Deinococcus arcticus]